MPFSWHSVTWYKTDKSVDNPFSIGEEKKLCVFNVYDTCVTVMALEKHFHGF